MRGRLIAATVLGVVLAGCSTSGTAAPGSVNAATSVSPSAMSSSGSASTPPAAAPVPVPEPPASGTTDVAPTGGVRLDAQGGGAGPQLCALFSSDEIAGWAGEPVQSGVVAGPLDSACAWDFAGGSGMVMISVVPAEYYVAADGTTPLDGIGDEGYLGTSLGGWDAAALIRADRAVIVSVDGAADDAGTAEAILRASFSRIAPDYQPSGTGLCDVLSLAEVSAWLETEVAATDATESSCGWASPDGSTTMQLALGAESEYELPADAKGVMKRSRIGDAAYTGPADGGGWKASVLVQGTGTITVTISGLDGAADVALDVAEAVLDRR